MHSVFKRWLTTGIAALLSTVMLTAPAAAVAEQADGTVLFRSAIDIAEPVSGRRAVTAEAHQIDFSLSDASGAPGTLIALSATLGHNSGFQDARIVLKFPEELEPDAPEGVKRPLIVNDALFPDSAKSSSVMQPTDDTICYIQEDCRSVNNGILFDVFFRIPADAKPGDTYQVECVDIKLSQNNTQLAVVTKSATVTVTEPPPRKEASVSFEITGNEACCWSENADSLSDLTGVSIKMRLTEEGKLNEKFAPDVTDAFALDTDPKTGLKPLPEDAGYSEQTVGLTVKDVSVLEKALKGTDYEDLLQEQGIKAGYRDSALTMKVGLIRRCDSNLDGEISLNDAQAALIYYTRIIVGQHSIEEALQDSSLKFLSAFADEKEKYLPLSVIAMDASNGDGVVGLEDAQYILNYYTHIVAGQQGSETEPPAVTTADSGAVTTAPTTKTTTVSTDSAVTASAVTTGEEQSASTDESLSTAATTDITVSHTEPEATGTSYVVNGLDISFWQGDVDFQRIKNEMDIDFIIVRAGLGRYTDQEDINFKTYYNSAKAAGFKVGAYWYSYAWTPEAARIEANVCMQVLGNRKFEYPIVFDIEEPLLFQSVLTGQTTPEVIGSIIDAFCSELEKNHYYAMVYNCPAYYNDTFVQPSSIRTRYDCWIAHWEVEKPMYYDAYSMWQYHVGPIPAGPENVDYDHDYSYKDFEAIIKKKHLNGY